MVKNPEGIFFGDVFEVRTEKGLAYCQYTHWHEEFGELIRALPGLYASRPEDLSALIARPSLFRVFYPLAEAVRRKLVEKVSSFPVPESESDFPLFRVRGLPDPKTMKVRNWSLWNGASQRPLGKLGRKYRRLPIRGIANHAMFVHYLETQWRSDQVVD